MLNKIIAILSLSILLVSCGTEVVDTTNVVEKVGTTIEAVQTEVADEDEVIQDFKNELDSLIESSSKD